eukprot:XP_011669015.1 PREDICTED: uncharacterized protein LOC105440495 isoform X2 [Strongylocentrotus purpuratus]
MRAVRKGTRALRRKRLPAHSYIPNIEHQSTVSRPVRDLLLSSRQSPRQFPQRRQNRQVNSAQAPAYQSPRQQSRGAVRQQTASGAHRGYRQQTSAGRTAHQTSLQPLQSQERPPNQPANPYYWQRNFTNPSEYPLQNRPPSMDDIYRQRIQSEVKTLQRLQSSRHHKEREHHDRINKHEIMKKLRDLRTDHLSRLSRLTPGESHSHGSSSPHPRKPPKIIQNYYPFVPHGRVQEDHGAAAPQRSTRQKTTSESTKIIPNYYPFVPHGAAAPHIGTPHRTTTESTSLATPTTTATPTTKATPTTTTASSPVGARPMTNRERMRLDRMEYQRLGSRTASINGRRDSGPFYRVSSTNRDDELRIPRRSDFETRQRESGLEVANNNEDRPDYASVDIPVWSRDGETISSMNLPKISQHEELGFRLLQEGTNSPNPTRTYSKDDPQSETPDDNIRSDYRESFAEYSEFVSADYDEIEDKIWDYHFNPDDGADAIYDTGVSVDTWGEAKSTKSKRDRSIIDAMNRRLVKQKDSMSASVTSERIMPELGMPQTEQAFRALQQDIINEERNEPESQEDITPRYSAKSPDVRPNVPQINQGFRSSTDNERYGRSNYLRSAIGHKVARARASRSAKEESDFETSASEPIEYSYDPSSDLQEADEFTGDVDGRSLDAEKFRKLQEEILEEEEVGKSQRNSGGNSRDGLSDNRDDIKGIRNGPVGHEDRLGGSTLSRNDLPPNDHLEWRWGQNDDITLDESYLEHIGQAENNDDVTLIDESYLEHIGEAENNGAATADRPSAPEPELTSIYDDEAEGRMEQAYDPVSGRNNAPQSQSEEWSEWSHCSSSCGHGTKTRHRACTGPNTNTCLYGVEYDDVKCALPKCSDEWDGAAVEVGEETPLSQWRDWSGWSVCSVSCGSGLSHRDRSCLQDPDKGPGCGTAQREETRTCRLDECNNVGGGGWKSEEDAARRTDHGQHHHHTKRIKCHLDESRAHLPMELFWTSPSGEKITHAMTHEKNSKYHIEGTTLVVTEDEPTEGSYHCIVTYGGSRGTNDKGKTDPMGACLSHPCHHKGVCLDQPSGQYNVSYRCMCPAGYEGMTCHMAPYLKGDFIVFSLMGWFIVSATVIIVVMYLGCSKKMKKQNMKRKLQLDDAPAEQLLARILPQIETMTYPDSETDEDTKPLLSSRTPQFGKELSAEKTITTPESTEKLEESGIVRFKSFVNKVTETTRKKAEGFTFPTLKQMKENITTPESTEELEQSGKVRFKSFVNKMAETTRNKDQGFTFPTSKQMMSLADEIKAQRNMNNSNTLNSSTSEGQYSDSNTTLSSSCESLYERDHAEGNGRLVNYDMNNGHYSSCESLPGKNNAEGCSRLVNNNMNNCSLDYSNVSSCAPCSDLNSSSIVGNDDDSLMEMSTDDFRDFQVANAFSVFKGSPSTREKQAVINSSLVYGNSNSTLVCNSKSLLDQMPGASEKHHMFHFDPTATDLTGPSDCSPERQNYGNIGCGLVTATSPRRCERRWPMRTPPSRGNGVRVRLPPSPSLSVSPSRLSLPPMGQRGSRMFGSTDEHAILEQYRKRRMPHLKHVGSPVSFETSPQESLDAARDRTTSGTSLPCFHRGRSHGTDSIAACFRDRSRTSPRSKKHQEYHVATGKYSPTDLTSIDTLTDETRSRRRLPTNRSLFRERASDSSVLLRDSTMHASRDMHQPFLLDESCTTSSDYVSVANQCSASTNAMTFGFPEYTNTMTRMSSSPNSNR